MKRIDSERKPLKRKTRILAAVYCGVVLAMTVGAVVLGSHFRMVINEDLRVSFTFICIMAVAGLLEAALL